MSTAKFCSLLCKSHKNNRLSFSKSHYIRIEYLCMIIPSFISHWRHFSDENFDWFSSCPEHRYGCSLELAIVMWFYRVPTICVLESKGKERKRISLHFILSSLESGVCNIILSYHCGYVFLKMYLIVSATKLKPLLRSQIQTFITFRKPCKRYLGFQAKK